MKAKIKEIFRSIQGEGQYVGVEQLFIRFCGCNLNCSYCDTDFSDDAASEYSPKELAEHVMREGKGVHSISLTGGEPLLHADFLKDFLPLVNKKIYLETNATLAENYLKIADFVDIVAADIKTEIENQEHFFEAAKGKEIFAKIVFNAKISDEKIEKSCITAKKFDLPLILQPEMNGEKMTVSSDEALEVFKKFQSFYENVRLIPQVHKFLNLR